jgi:hypothetical protein
MNEYDENYKVDDGDDYEPESQETAISDEDVRQIAFELSDDVAADVAGAMLDVIKTTQKPWSAMSRMEQGDVIYAVKTKARSLVYATVRRIAADGRQTIVATCKKVEFGDKALKATFEAEKSSEFRHELADSSGKECLIVVADAAPYLGGDYPQEDAPRDGQPDMFDANDDDGGPVFDKTASAVH